MQSCRELVIKVSVWTSSQNWTFVSNWNFHFAQKKSSHSMFSSQAQNWQLPHTPADLSQFLSQHCLPTNLLRQVQRTQFSSCLNGSYAKVRRCICHFFVNNTMLAIARKIGYYYRPHSWMAGGHSSCRRTDFMEFWCAFNMLLGALSILDECSIT